MLARYKFTRYSSDRESRFWIKILSLPLILIAISVAFAFGQTTSPTSASTDKIQAFLIPCEATKIASEAQLSQLASFVRQNKNMGKFLVVGLASCDDHVPEDTTYANNRYRQGIATVLSNDGVLAENPYPPTGCGEGRKRGIWVAFIPHDATVKQTQLLEERMNSFKRRTEERLLEAERRLDGNDSDFSYLSNRITHVETEIKKLHSAPPTQPEKKGMSTGTKIALGTGAAILVGTVTYLLTRGNKNVVFGDGRVQ